MVLIWTGPRLAMAVFSWGRKKSVLTDPNFFSPKNHNPRQVHMVHELFLSINLVLTALKLIKIGNLTLFSS